MTTQATAGLRGETRANAQLRGSTLLLAGRFLAIAANLLVQVLVVRYLSQRDYGAFAYGIAVVNLLTVFVGLGLEQAIQRFAAIYDEQRAHDKLIGSIALQLAAVAFLGTLVVLGFWGASSSLHGLIDDPRAISLLAVLVLLAPLQAIDGLIMSLFAVFANPRMIFFRRYVFAPVLKIVVASAVVLAGGDVFALAWGWVLATLAGIAVYVPPLLGTLRRHEVLAPGRRVSFPARELFRFTLVAVVSDLVVILLFASDAIMVGLFEGAEGVALVQAVSPVANGNLLVFYAVIPLFIPFASRLFAHREMGEMASLYRRSSVWIIVFTTPVFLLTFSFAGQLAVALFGSEYRQSGAILALIALGQFVQASLGLTGLSLKVVADLRLLAILNLAAAVLNFAFDVTLIPAFGPVGAALGTAIVLVALNVSKVFALERATGIATTDPNVLRAAASVSAVAVAGLLFSLLASPPLVVGFVYAAVATVIVIVVNRSALDVADVFPALARVRLLKHVLHPRGAQAGAAD